VGGVGPLEAVVGQVREERAEGSDLAGDRQIGLAGVSQVVPPGGDVLREGPEEFLIVTVRVVREGHELGEVAAVGPMSVRGHRFLEPALDGPAEEVAEFLDGVAEGAAEGRGERGGAGRRDGADVNGREGGARGRVGVRNSWSSPYL
jgi:hypothetical protein